MTVGRSDGCGFHLSSCRSLIVLSELFMLSFTTTLPGFDAVNVR